ncbi:SUMO protease ULP2 [Aspergillus homomorphus CBS 101889]|uniref:Cysteine proteinase n=1 Tax=Aspergillus homomorphus (strain CBS 101889) TaxID=1450537 RepID=A0A395HSH1_ASPHC|nr:cysteine proteinase [Aspergillus homomorphus CBS 101889]RAL09184.1 cysteine proteinase [Aspergillus homomorphus CBS 101889]
MVLSPDEKSHRPTIHNLNSYAKDEARLLPTSSQRPDPNGVAIVPGQAGKIMKKKKGDSPYGPIDRISGKTRQSGPVRASKREPRPYGRHTEEDSTAAASGRPHKRPRLRAQEPSSSSLTGNLLALTDRGIEEYPVLEIPPTATHPSRMSSTSSQLSKTSARKERNNSLFSKEYRAVEDMIHVPQQQHRKGAKYGKKPPASALPDDVHEERFTENAASERRRRPSSDGAGIFRTDRPDRAPKHEVFKGVEVVSSKEQDAHHRMLALGPRVRHGSTSPTEIRDLSDTHDSTDELVAVEVTSKKATDKIPSEKEAVLAKKRQRSSPSDIQPTDFSPSKTSFKNKRGLKRKEPKAAATIADPSSKPFKVVYAHLGHEEKHASDRQGIELVMDEKRNKLSLHIQNDPAGDFELPFNRINRVISGTSASCRVTLWLSKIEGHHQRVDMELSSPEERVRICTGLKARNVTMQFRDEDWMEGSFEKYGKEQKRHPNGLKRPASASPEKVVERPVEPVKRMRLADSLQDERGNPTVTAPGKPPGRSNSAAKSNPTSPDVSPRASNPSSGLSVQIPVKTSLLTSARLSDRQTRAMSRRYPSTTVVSDDDNEEDHSAQSQSDGPIKKWHEPLVYPRFGKKKAEVNMQDRDRLRRNDEFLNDNLIEFYIRFLQEHLSRTNEEVAKRVYFFNSFFYDTLMNIPRGKKGVNYDGVQKWTRNVDIFSHDFVVVPINEHAHWYVAIICNLPNLQELSEPQILDEPLSSEVQSSAQLDSQVQEIPETPPPQAPLTDEGTSTPRDGDAEPAKEEQTRHSLASMSLADEPQNNASKEATPADEWPEREEMSSLPAQKFPHAEAELPSSQAASSQSSAKPTESSGKAGRKPPTKRTTKFDITQPTIITFDSLGMTRTPTSRILREYLYEEAKSKKGIEIAAKCIRGITAQKIPLQPNFSDCGLYLLAYMEKFVQDPDTFIRKILQKEDVEWPPLKSGHLRKRLRKFLDALYDEQAQLSRQETGAKETMADRTPICYLLGSSLGSPEVQRKMKTVESPAKVPDEQALTSPCKAPEQSGSPSPAKRPKKSDSPSPSKAPENHPLPENGAQVCEPQVETEEAAEAETGDKETGAREEPEVSLVSSTQNKKEPSSPRPEPRESAPKHVSQEVIEVPDSQEPSTSPTKIGLKTTKPHIVMTSPSKIRLEATKPYTKTTFQSKAIPETTKPHTPITSPSKAKPETKPYTPLHLSALSTESETKTHGNEYGSVLGTPVETQVPGTPSKPTLVKDSPSKPQ